MAERISRVKWRENLLMCYMDGLVTLSQHFPLDQAYNPLPEFGSSEMQGASSLQLLSSGKIFFSVSLFPSNWRWSGEWGGWEEERSHFKGQTPKTVKDPPMKYFEVNQKVCLTSATISLTVRLYFHLCVKWINSGLFHNIQFVCSLNISWTIFSNDYFSLTLQTVKSGF